MKNSIKLGNCHITSILEGDTRLFLGTKENTIFVLDKNFEELDRVYIKATPLKMIMHRGSSLIRTHRELRRLHNQVLRRRLHGGHEYRVQGK